VQLNFVLKFMGHPQPDLEENWNCEVGWVQNKMKTKWKQNENKMKTKWKQNENKMKTKWKQNENKMKTKWKQMIKNRKKSKKK
jgi:hypothetical protein